jgi:hypothetical protein
MSLCIDVLKAGGGLYMKTETTEKTKDKKTYKREVAGALLLGLGYLVFMDKL